MGPPWKFKNLMKVSDYISFRGLNNRQVNWKIISVRKYCFLTVILTSTFSVLLHTACRRAVYIDIESRDIFILTRDIFGLRGLTLRVHHCLQAFVKTSVVLSAVHVRLLRVLLYN